MPRRGTVVAAVTGSASRPLPDEVASLEFDLEDLKTHGWFAKLTNWALKRPQWLLEVFRRLWPVAVFPFTKWAVVALYDDVQEVLREHRVFGVPWGEKVALMNGGPNFLLGMAAGDDYWRIQRQVMAVFRHEDVAKIVTPMAARFSEDIVANSGGRLDAIESLISRVPTLLCKHYFGVKIGEQDLVDFARWTIAMSMFAFGDPGNNPRFWRAALAASARLRPLIDQSITEAKAAKDLRDDVLGRLVAMQRANAEGLSDLAIRAYLIGMITGFVPTNTMAAGKALETLLRRPDFLARCQEAARADADDLLRRCLREAMRFNPIFMGPLRVCTEDFTVAQGTRRAKTIRKGTNILASTQSAMFDPRRVAKPYAFNPDRPTADYMLFGFGLHWCLGALIAEAQITQTFKALLKRPTLRPAAGKAGQLEWLGQFPGHLWVEFGAAGAKAPEADRGDAR